MRYVLLSYYHSDYVIDGYHVSNVYTFIGPITREKFEKLYGKYPFGRVSSVLYFILATYEADVYDERGWNEMDFRIVNTDIIVSTSNDLFPFFLGKLYTHYISEVDPNHWGNWEEPKI